MPTPANKALVVDLMQSDWRGVGFATYLQRRDSSRCKTHWAQTPLALFSGYSSIVVQPRTVQPISATRLLLEYDDDRSGSFAPLRHVPDDKIVVLGLISTKRLQMEAPEDLVRRITQANRFLPLERLALSSQCGFASSIVGNGLSIEDERRKLERVCETARRIWT